MLGKRIISAVIGIILLVAILVLGEIYLNVGIAVISIIALYELFSAVEGLKKLPIVWPAYISAVAIAFSNYISHSWMMLLVYAYAAILFLLMLVYYNTINFRQIAITFFGVVYICYFLAHIVYTRDLAYGSVLIWLIFLGAWATDTFAYFIGTQLGKRKFMPKISPKKSIEGALGGIVGCTISFLVYGYIISVLGNYSVNYNYLLVLGIICSVISEFGDLAASCIKRQWKIKDFGHIMPGHGGILDRFDSIIFVAPIVYYFVSNFKIIC